MLPRQLRQTLTAHALPSQYKEGSWPQRFSVFWGWQAGSRAGQQAQGQLEDCCQEVRNATFTGGMKTVPTQEAASVGREKKEGSSKSVLLNHSCSHTARKYWWDLKYLSALAWISHQWATSACTSV